MALTPWEPFEELLPAPLEGAVSLRDAMNRLFASSMMSPRWLEPFGRMLPVDVRETDSEYVIDASMPGVKPNELQVSATDNAITIRASHKAEEETKRGGTYLRRERYEGEMSRVIGLSSPIDPNKVTASYEHGVLVLHAPKTAAAKAKQIEIKVKESTTAH
jgi:HSP20 family protein